MVGLQFSAVDLEIDEFAPEILVHRSLSLAQPLTSHLLGHGLLLHEALSK
jgi:hypothetical protein